VRNILSHLTKNRVIALLIGLGITALIQSSSASTVMTIGFVNAGLLSLKQAVSVNLGANIGTTFTAWLIAIIGKFKISTYALPAIGIGFYLRTSSNKRRFNEIGTILLGFGLLFLGLDIMKDAFGSLKESDVVVDMFTQFSTNPLLGVLVGTIFTMILQSSSATIAIVQLLAFQGVISFDAALPLILGDNIGTTITAELASIGTSPNAKRAARANTLFNVIGVCIILPFVWVGLYGKFVEFLFPGEITQTNIMAHIAVAHSAFNVINATIFMVFINALLRAADMLVVKKKGLTEMTPQLLQEQLLPTPALAMEQVIKEIIRMAKLARKGVQYAQKGFNDSNEVLLKKAWEIENALDDFQHSITAYLVRISEQHLVTRESNEYPVLLHTVNDLEKIGDYSDNIVIHANHKIKGNFVIDENAATHVARMFDKVYEMFDIVISALESRDSVVAREAIGIEDELDFMKIECRKEGVERLKVNTGNAETEIIIMDLARNIEKMGDHLLNIAEAVGNELQWSRKTSLDE
jgi:phosphate:Na+ symporter